MESKLAAGRKAVADVEKSLKELENGMQAVKVEVHKMGKEKRGCRGQVQGS